MDLCRAAGTSDDDIDTMVWKNPVGFFGRDGRGSEAEWLDSPDQDRKKTFDGNSVLRGQDPEGNWDREPL